jgi:hypothetical protein
MERPELLFPISLSEPGRVNDLLVHVFGSWPRRRAQRFHIFLDHHELVVHVFRISGIDVPARQVRIKERGMEDITGEAVLET